MDTLELCGDIRQPGGQLETPGLVSFIEDEKLMKVYMNVIMWLGSSTIIGPKQR